MLRYLSKRYDKFKRSSKHRKVNAAAALCPDHASLDRYLAGLLGFLSTQYYRAVSLFELIPAWLRFLKSVNLIDASMAEDTLQRLMPLRDSLLTMCQKRFDDPALEQALAAWPDKNPT